MNKFISSAHQGKISWAHRINPIVSPVSLSGDTKTLNPPPACTAEQGKNTSSKISITQRALHARVNILSALLAYKNSISVDWRRREKTRQWTIGRAQHLRERQKTRVNKAPYTHLLVNGWAASAVPLCSASELLSSEAAAAADTKQRDHQLKIAWKVRVYRLLGASPRWRGSTLTANFLFSFSNLCSFCQKESQVARLVEVSWVLVVRTIQYFPASLFWRHLMRAGIYKNMCCKILLQ